MSTGKAWLDTGASLVAHATGQDRGDELRRQAEYCGHRTVQHHVRELRLVESVLAHAAMHDWTVFDRSEEYAPDVVRRHMLRGMITAHQKLGDHVVFWMPR